MTGNDCLTRGNISGTYFENNANMTIQSGVDTVTLDATADNIAHAMNGRWDYTALDREEYMGETDEFSTYLATYSAHIRC